MIAVVTGLVAACGARTGLFVSEAPNGPPKSDEYCVHADYRSGYSDLSIYILLDSSESMGDDNKWDYATAALSAFVADPDAAGLDIGLQFFPLGSSCDETVFANPAVPIAPLPGNANAIDAALARAAPDGETPTLPALRGGVEYARALLSADPTRDVVVAIVTDGAPDACMSTTDAVAGVAAEAANSDPEVLTYAIGLENGFVAQMNQIAAAGGTGEAILLGADPSTAQDLVTTLRTLRDNQRNCRYAVPPVAGVVVSPYDLTVAYTLTPGAPSTPLALVGGIGSCGADGGFFVDDPTRPKILQLCPATCTGVHMSTSSHVAVSAGCGAGAPDGGPLDAGDDGETFCTGSTNISCWPTCMTYEPSALPICIEGEWGCPAGFVSSDTCATCPAVPHGCCEGDGTFEQASCVDSNWVCPPGGTPFGSAGCEPPAQCAALMPCGGGDYCKVANATCGNATTLGACAPIPATCSDDTPTCGCDGQTYSSACTAAMSGVDVSATESCTPPAGTFTCGPYFCRVADQICDKEQDFANANAPDSWSCIASTGACPTGCECNACGSCVAGHMCSQVCTGDTQSGRQITCTSL
jgi:hypothetical protein